MNRRRRASIAMDGRDYRIDNRSAHTLLRRRKENCDRSPFHPHGRFFVMISCTWWVGTGETFAPDSTVPLPAGG